MPGFAFPSGVLALVVLAVMVVGSMSCVRRSGYFQVRKVERLIFIESVTDERHKGTGPEGLQVARLC